MEDTDGDGLTDYDEIYVTLTDPLKIDSNDNGIIDSEEDFDKDGLKTLEEIRINKNPYFSRKVGNEELSEEFLLRKLDSSNIVNGLLRDNLAIPSITYISNKEYKNNIMLLESGLNLTNNAIIGKIVSIENDIDESLNLSFDVSEAIKNNNDIRYLAICKYDNNTFNLVDTIISGNSISTNIVGEGDYFVLNVEKFLDELSKEKKKNEVILNNYKKVVLEKKVDKDNNCDTDKDGISDYEELGELIEVDLSEYVNIILRNKNISRDEYKGITKIQVYNNISDPTLKDSDNDGFTDDVDPSPLEAKEFIDYNKYINYRYKNEYVLTVINRQPFLNSRLVINMEHLDAGHTEISIDNAKGNLGIYGFYPYEKYTMYDVLYLNSCKGRIRLKDSYYLTDVIGNVLVKEKLPIDATKGEWNVGKSFVVDKDTINILNEYSSNYTYNYNMVNKNCSTFVMDALNHLGIEMNVERHNWTYLEETENYHTKKFKGYTPADISQDIIENYNTYVTNEEITLNNGENVKAIVVH